jgi:hypothetical protein
VLVRLPWAKASIDKHVPPADLLRELLERSLHVAQHLQSTLIAENVAVPALLVLSAGIRIAQILMLTYTLHRIRSLLEEGPKMRYLRSISSTAFWKSKSSTAFGFRATGLSRGVYAEMAAAGPM